MGNLRNEYSGSNLKWTAEEIATWDDPDPEETPQPALLLVVNNGISPTSY